MKKLAFPISLAVAAGVGRSVTRAISSAIADYEARSDAMDRNRATEYQAATASATVTPITPRPALVG